jgi:hypothetical protein
MQKEMTMSMIQRSPKAISAFAAVLVFALCAPIAVNADDEVIAAEEQLLVAAPAAPSWDETSGYGSVEASRAEISALFAPVTGPSWDATSGYGSVEASRSAASVLLAAGTAPSWDDTSGYGSVEASRATIPIGVEAEDAAAPQTITIHDERTGDGPCGFMVERTLDGTVALVPSIDATGNLVLAIEPVTLHGTLSNPATGKSVELRWVRSNGVVDFGYDGTTTTVALALDGHFFRGYDGGRTDLTMTLPVDGAERLAFEAGERSADPWSHVCGFLA